MAEPPSPLSRAAIFLRWFVSAGLAVSVLLCSLGGGGDRVGRAHRVSEGEISPEGGCSEILSHIFIKFHKKFLRCTLSLFGDSFLDKPFQGGGHFLHPTCNSLSSFTLKIRTHLFIP